MTAILIACLFVMGGYAGLWGVIKFFTVWTRDNAAN
jgi:hypothetical protein